MTETGTNAGTKYLWAAHTCELLAFALCASMLLARRFTELPLYITLLGNAVAIIIYGITYYRVFRVLPVADKVRGCYFNNFALLWVIPIFGLYRGFAMGAGMAAMLIFLVIAYRAVAKPGGHPVPLTGKFWSRKPYMGF